MKTKAIQHLLVVVALTATPVSANPCIGVYKGTFHADNQVAMEVAARPNDDGSVKANARITAHLNGVLIHDDVEIPHPTANPSADVKAAGPIELQDHGHPIQFRNIWLVKGK
ncbi:MAG TPA: DUF1080 domain-containing protein [Phycisphaerales bacterium]|nr:DUF1080 domain-containing protein [Phycisphaerales bacterium]